MNAQRDYEPAQGEVLHTITEALPGCIEVVLRKNAHQQPEECQKMGKDGIRTLRTDLAKRVSAIAELARRRS